VKPPTNDLVSSISRWNGGRKELFELTTTSATATSATVSTSSVATTTTSTKSSHLGKTWVNLLLCFSQNGDEITSLLLVWTKS
jgi:hypothetical protein